MALAGLICFLVLLPNTASARVHFHISLGTRAVHDCSGFHIGRHPHCIWHRGYYRWLDSDRYRGPCVFRRRSCCCRRRPLCSSGVSIWIRDWYPIVVDRPIAVEVPKVITKRQVAVKTREYDEETAELFEQLRRKKSELLKKLKEGNKEHRKEAIDKLAGFSFDDKVREALEDILLSDSDPELRKEVAKSLGKVKNKKVLSALEKAKAEDSNEEVRQEANKAVKIITEL